MRRNGVTPRSGVLWNVRKLNNRRRSPFTIMSGRNGSKQTSLHCKSLNPILCNEYMARAVGSTFYTILPLAKKSHVAVINRSWWWGRRKPTCRGSLGNILTSRISPHLVP
jgi:hypothetical protein